MKICVMDFYSEKSNMKKTVPDIDESDSQILWQERGNNIFFKHKKHYMYTLHYVYSKIPLVRPLDRKTVPPRNHFFKDTTIRTDWLLRPRFVSPGLISRSSL